MKPAFPAYMPLGMLPEASSWPMRPRPRRQRCSPLPEGAPTLDITRRTFHEHCAIDYSRTLFRADRYTLWVPVAAPNRLPPGPLVVLRG